MPNFEQVHFGRGSPCYLFHNAIDLTWGPPVHRQTDTTENITTYAGGNNYICHWQF